MKYKVGILIIVLLAALGLVKYLSMPLIPEGGTSMPFKDWNKISLGGRIINLELALTALERERGLSHREKSTFHDDTGKLFIFDKPGLHSFWMKDMNFPIDIIWLDQNMKIVHIKEQAEPSSYPESFAPSPLSPPARYVLEVNAHFASSTGIKIGDEAKILK